MIRYKRRNEKDVGGKNVLPTQLFKGHGIVNK